MTDQEKLDLYNELLKNHSPDEVLALKFGLAETMGVRKQIEQMIRMEKKFEELRYWCDRLEQKTRIAMAQMETEFADFHRATGNRYVRK